jgi:acetyl-CoA carboxylase carboxyltransferase component
MTDKNQLIMEAKVKDLIEIKNRIINSNTDEQLKGRFKKRQLTARERIKKLLDTGSFTELDMFVTHHSGYFGMDKRKVPADGVVSGHGKINGRLVFVYSQDFLALGGSFGEMHGNKILKVMTKAMDAGAPVIGLLESGGARLHEVMGPLIKFGELFYTNTLASGVIPQISATMGSVAGGQAYSPGLTDFIFMTKDSSMYIAGPAFVQAQTGTICKEEELGSAEMHAKVSGVADFVTEDDEHCLLLIRELLSYLPSSNREKPPYRESESLDVDRDDEGKDFYFAAANPNRPFDMHKVIERIVDGGRFFEVKRLYAQNVICGFARFQGHSAGVVASQSMVLGGCIDCRAAEKAARFVRFCDAFNIPIVTLQDSPAYMIGKEEEQNGIITRGAKLLHAYSEATVPKITVIVRNGCAGSHIAMGSKMVGADYVLAWATANIWTVAPTTAASIIFRKEIEKAQDRDKAYQEKIQEYTDKFGGPYYGASHQLIDDVIDPRDTRKAVIAAIEATLNKSVVRPWRKHSNIPI